MKATLLKAAKTLLVVAVTAIVSTVVTNFITGQPLTGLTKFAGLYQTFIKSSVPAWAFALVFLVALFGLYFSYTHWPRRKGKVHFVPDQSRCGWAVQPNNEMSIQLRGVFTYEENDTLTILTAFLRGTQPPPNILVNVESQPNFRPLVGPNFGLQGRVPAQIFMSLSHLKPVLGTKGKMLRRHLILRDKFERDFDVGAVDFRYMD